jgi:8-oxo-dGTP pyrophosphatase MutT (NUDIX family)
MTTTVDSLNISSVLASHLDALTAKIRASSNICQDSAQEEFHQNYLETLRTIHTLTLPLFEALLHLERAAGFSAAELLEAWPKGRCENFVFAVRDQGNVEKMILAKNKKWGFLQNGGGKTPFHETSHAATFREAQEEFGFNGRSEQVKYITVESESGIPSFHFVKGVHVIEITTEQAAELKLGDDMASNEIISLSLDEFLLTADNDLTPIDHGFDRKSIALYLMEKKAGISQFYNERITTKVDCNIAEKAYAWMNSICVPKTEIAGLERLFAEFVENELKAPVDAEAIGAWKSAANREMIKKAAQKVVDAIVLKLLPAWTYEGKKGEETACQVKVQEATGVSVNGEVLPSFLTIPQMFLLQAKRFEEGVAILMEEGSTTDSLHCRDIQVVPASQLLTF